MGVAVTAPTMAAFLGGCKSEIPLDTEGFPFSTQEQALLAELAEVIIPKTDTPGAKEAGVGAFIALMLADCYTEGQRQNFKSGLVEVGTESKKLGGSFVELSDGDKIKVMTILSENAKKMASADKVKVIDSETGVEKDEGKIKAVPFFKLLKELTTLGYFTSEIGQTLALDHVPIPGKYEACIDLAPGQKAYAM